MTDNQIDFTVETNNLYREENIIDLKSASIRCLTPIKPDGTTDESREKIFMGHTQLMSSQGHVPLHAPLKASTLEEAMKNFPEAMQHAMAEMVENIKKMQQEQEKSKQKENSRIIVPGR
ncbi:MAG: cytoplasmic protein [Desulfosarcina sp.]|nr:cytoplasmic protein [Desulfobacterales bacterium]